MFFLDDVTDISKYSSFKDIKLDLNNKINSLIQSINNTNKKDKKSLAKILLPRFKNILDQFNTIIELKKTEIDEKKKLEEKIIYDNRIVERKNFFDILKELPKENISILKVLEFNEWIYSSIINKLNEQKKFFIDKKNKAIQKAEQFLKKYPSPNIEEEINKIDFNDLTKQDWKYLDNNYQLVTFYDNIQNIPGISLLSYEESKDIALSKFGIYLENNQRLFFSKKKDSLSYKEEFKKIEDIIKLDTFNKCYGRITPTTPSDLIKILEKMGHNVDIRNVKTGTHMVLYLTKPNGDKETAIFHVHHKELKSPVICSILRQLNIHTATYRQYL